MSVTYTPLRYPGGKTKIYDVVKDIILANGIIETYIEPFAGGAGLALKLLINNDVKRIVMNDSDPAIYAFWYMALYHTEELCEFVMTVPLDVETWKNMRRIYLDEFEGDYLSLGEAAFYLNRVNRSGIIKGGLIGGKEQSGTYKMDARFNREALVNKIRTIAAYKDRIDLYNLDVLDFLKPNILRQYPDALINFDPPYVDKGGQLYMNFFTEDDHRKLAETIAQVTKKWIVTYDQCDLIKDLYSEYRGSVIDITYSAHHKGKTQEYIFFSDNLNIPEIMKTAYPKG